MEHHPSGCAAAGVRSSDAQDRGTGGRLNFYKHFLGDYARDTAHLSLLEHGAYRVLLDSYYATEKPLPAEKAALYRICKAFSAGERRAVDRVAEQFFPANGDGRRHNPRADEEIASAQAFADAQAMRAHMRWHKPADAPGTCEGNASHSHSQKKERTEERSRGSRLPPDWRPSEELISWAETARPDLDIPALIEKFRDHWASKPGKDGRKLDWDATFRNWVRDERRGATTPRKPPKADL